MKTLGLQSCAAQIGFGPRTPVWRSLPLLVTRCAVVLYGLLAGGQETAIGNETATEHVNGSSHSPWNPLVLFQWG